MPSEEWSNVVRIRLKLVGTHLLAQGPQWSCSQSSKNNLGWPNTPNHPMIEFIQATMWPNFHCQLWSEEWRMELATWPHFVAKCLFYKPLGVDSAQSKAHNTHVESFLKSKVEHHRKLFPRKIIVFLRSCLAEAKRNPLFFNTSRWLPWIVNR